MPYMPRPDKKAEKIAWKNLGKPENLAVKPSEREKKINAKLDYQIIVDGR
jgi:hypothetical protein